MPESRESTESSMGHRTSASYITLGTTSCSPNLANILSETQHYPRLHVWLEIRNKKVQAQKEELSELADQSCTFKPEYPTAKYQVATPWTATPNSLNQSPSISPLCPRAFLLQRGRDSAGSHLHGQDQKAETLTGLREPLVSFTLTH